LVPFSKGLKARQGAAQDKQIEPLGWMDPFHRGGPRVAFIGEMDGAITMPVNFLFKFNSLSKKLKLTGDTCPPKKPGFQDSPHVGECYSGESTANPCKRRY
jgi:hypothetical protein